MEYILVAYWWSKGARENLSFSVVADVVTLCQMPNTIKSKSCLKVFSNAIAVVSNLQSAVVLNPLKAFCHHSPSSLI